MNLMYCIIYSYLLLYNLLLFLQNIDTLTELLDLNLASNSIATLDNGSLSSFYRLRKLNLSGNPLTSLEVQEHM